MAMTQPGRRTAKPKRGASDEEALDILVHIPLNSPGAGAWKVTMLEHSSVSAYART